MPEAGVDLSSYQEWKKEGVEGQVEAPAEAIEAVQAPETIGAEEAKKEESIKERFRKVKNTIALIMALSPLMNEAKPTEAAVLKNLEVPGKVLELDNSAKQEMGQALKALLENQASVIDKKGPWYEVAKKGKEKVALSLPDKNFIIYKKGKDGYQSKSLDAGSFLVTEADLYKKADVKPVLTAEGKIDYKATAKKLGENLARPESYATKKDGSGKSLVLVTNEYGGRQGFKFMLAGDYVSPGVQEVPNEATGETKRFKWELLHLKGKNTAELIKQAGQEIKVKEGSEAEIQATAVWVWFPVEE